MCLVVQVCLVVEAAQRAVRDSYLETLFRTVLGTKSEITDIRLARLQRPSSRLCTYLNNLADYVRNYIE